MSYFCKTISPSFAKYYSFHFHKKMIPSQQTFKRSSKKDEFESPDFYGMDDLLTEEQLMIRSAVQIGRAHV